VAGALLGQRGAARGVQSAGSNSRCWGGGRGVAVAWLWVKVGVVVPLECRY